LHERRIRNRHILRLAIHKQKRSEEKQNKFFHGPAGFIGQVTKTYGNHLAEEKGKTSFFEGSFFLAFGAEQFCFSGEINAVLTNSKSTSISYFDAHFVLKKANQAVTN
jgi:hypothetical protein